MSTLAPTLSIKSIDTDGQIFIDSRKGDISVACNAPRFLFGNPKACSRPSVAIYPNRTVIYKDIVPFADGTSSVGSPLLPFDTIYVKNVAGDVVFNGNVRFTKPVNAPLNDITKTSSILLENVGSNVVFEPVRSINTCTASNAFTKWAMVSTSGTGLEFRQNGPCASLLPGGSNSAFIQNTNGELYIGGTQNARAMSFFSSGPLAKAVCIGVTPENASTLVSLEKSNLSTYKLVVNGTAWSTGWRTVSDATMKENVLPITGALSKLQSISGYTYHLKRGDEDGESKKSAGLMAQDVARVLPEAVDVLHDGSYALDYNGVVSLLVEAVKELDMRSRKDN